MCKEARPTLADGLREEQQAELADTAHRARRCSYVKPGSDFARRAWNADRSAILASQVDFRRVEDDPGQPNVVLVETAVHEERHYRDELAHTDRKDAGARDGIEVRSAPDVERLGLRVVLSAVLADGRQVTEDNCLGLGGPPAMRLTEVSELLERMLGRNPALHRPPRLAWDPLLSALKSIGVTSTERELIAAPLEIRLEPSARPVVTID